MNLEEVIIENIPLNPIHQNNIPQNTHGNVYELFNALTKSIVELKTKDFCEVLENYKSTSDLFKEKLENELNYNLKYNQIIKKIVLHTCENYKIVKTPGSIFIKKCFKFIECHFRRGLINCAADLADPYFMCSILIYPDIDVDNFNEDSYYKRTTPLNTLIKNLNTKNFYDTFDCIKLLLNYGANPNVPDGDITIPIINLINNDKLWEEKKKELLEYFLSCTEINPKIKDYIRLRFDPKTEKIVEHISPESLLKIETFTFIPSQFNDMVWYLETSQENKFIKQFEKIDISKIQDYNANVLYLLNKAIQHGLLKAFDIIMEKIQVNINYRYEGFTPIKTACCYGNATAVQKLLNHKNLKIHCTDNLLITVITKLDKLAGWEFSDYYSCFYALLNSNKIDINETDQKGYSALHYAIMENNYKPVEELLKHGAYIGARNIFNEFAITNLNSVIIEKYFDACITAKGSSVASHKAFSNININYINLVPPKTEELISTEPSTEMTIIEHISNTNYLRNLIKHPLIKSFLYMKWLQLAILFHINFIFYLQYFISLLLLTIATFTNFTGNNDKSLIVLLLIGIAYLIIRESIQFIMFPKNYCKSISNYFEYLLIIITILFLEAVVNDDIKMKKKLAVTVILMAVLELYLLITSLQYLIISEYMLMFKKVLFTFIRSFAVFFIIILTFSLCFFILLHNENAVIVNITETNSTDSVVGKHEDQNEFNKFTNYIAIVKTIVMMTGEYDGSNINFNSSFSYLIFLLFIFLVPIVIFNLLSGLAVDDAKEIRNEAILYQSINLINNLSKYDKIFTRKIRPGRISFKNFRRWLQKLYIKYFILFNDEHKILEYRLESNIFNNNKILVKTFKDSNSMIWSTKTNLESNLKTYINIISTWLKLDINFNNAVLSVIAKKQPN